MALIIPIEPIPAKRFRTTLEGYDVVIRYRWQTWIGQWYIDADCEDLNIHTHGFALVTGRDCIANRSLKQLGTLVLVDLQGDEDPDFDGLGTRWVLMYYTRAEVDAAT